MEIAKSLAKTIDQTLAGPLSSKPACGQRKRAQAVLITVRLVPAVSTEEAISFRQIHEPSGTPIKYVKGVRDGDSFTEVPDEEIVKDYEHAKGHLCENGLASRRGRELNQVLRGVDLVHVIRRTDCLRQRQATSADVCAQGVRFAEAPRGNDCFTRLGKKFYQRGLIR